MLLTNKHKNFKPIFQFSIFGTPYAPEPSGGGGAPKDYIRLQREGATQKIRNGLQGGESI